MTLGVTLSARGQVPLTLMRVGTYIVQTVILQSVDKFAMATGVWDRTDHNRGQCSCELRGDKRIEPTDPTTVTLGMGAKWDASHRIGVATFRSSAV